jgi:hypothetical protein
MSGKNHSGASTTSNVTVTFSTEYDGHKHVSNPLHAHVENFEISVPGQNERTGPPLSSKKTKRPSFAAYLTKHENVEFYVKVLKYSNFVTLFLTFSIALCIILMYVYTSELFTSQMRTIFGVLLFSAAFNLIGIALSLLGQKTVADDVAQEVRKSHSASINDANTDGRNTPGQLKILFGFYVAFVCGANVVICGMALAFNAGSFSTLTSSLKSDVFNGNYAAIGYPFVIVCIFCYMISNAISMWASSAITTFYTVMQSLLQVLCVIYSCVSLVMIFGAVYALCMNQFSGSNDLGFAAPLVYTVVWGVLMFGVNIFGVVATKGESVKGLKIFAASLLFMSVLLFIGIGLGSQDANKTIDNKCAQVVTVMSDRGWHHLFQCNKYSGCATRYDSVLKDHVKACSSIGVYSFNHSAVGEETYCDKNDDKTKTLFAWEFNVLGRLRDPKAKKKYVPTDKVGRRVDWYGCLNYKCCDVLKAWIGANRSYFFAAAFGMFLLLLLGIYVAMRMARDVESKNTHSIAHGKDICIGLFIGLLLVLGGMASIVVATSVPISPQKSRGSIFKDKNITSDLPVSSNESTICHSTTAMGGNGTCISCFNAKMDGDEVGIDCGGSCALRCATGQTCGASDISNNISNCAVGLACSSDSGICTEPTYYDLCTDSILNNGESDIDCGYSCFNYTGQLCQLNQLCKIDSDCSSGSCHTNDNNLRVCVSCDDGVRSGLETDVDCGGPSCKRCSDGKIGNSSKDCISGYLDVTTRLCSSCNDGVISGDKTDVSCGSTLRDTNTGHPLTSSMSCPKCNDTQICVSNYDCTSNHCQSNRCVSCFNAVQDGNETCIDGGGSCNVKCDVDQACETGADCSTGFCKASNKKCREAVDSDYCPNNKIDSETGETDVDCGGASCRRVGIYCDDGKKCAINEDCKSGSCVDNKCVSCSNNVIDGSETDVDCGGNQCQKCNDICTAAAGCVNGQSFSSHCNSGEDCQSGRCFLNKCISCK